MSLRSRGFSYDVEVKFINDIFFYVHLMKCGVQIFNVDNSNYQLKLQTCLKSVGVEYLYII